MEERKTIQEIISDRCKFKPCPFCGKEPKFDYGICYLELGKGQTDPFPPKQVPNWKVTLRCDDCRVYMFLYDPDMNSAVKQIKEKWDHRWTPHWSEK